MDGEPAAAHGAQVSRTYRATFTGFMGAQFSADIHAYTMDEAIETCQAHMCAGDLLTIEET
jgi:hypothetical protein